MQERRRQSVPPVSWRHNQQMLIASGIDACDHLVNEGSGAALVMHKSTEL